MPWKLIALVMLDALVVAAVLCAVHWVFNPGAAGMTLAAALLGDSFGRHRFDRR